VKISRTIELAKIYALVALKLPIEAPQQPRVRHTRFEHPYTIRRLRIDELPLADTRQRRKILLISSQAEGLHSARAGSS